MGEATSGFNPAYKNWLTEKINEIGEAQRLSSPYVCSLLDIQKKHLQRILSGNNRKLSPKERFAQRAFHDPGQDCILTAIKKWGGIDVTLCVTNERFWEGRLNPIQPVIVGLPNVERPGKGTDLEKLAESAFQSGYIGKYDWHQLEECLGLAEGGQKVLSRFAHGDVVMAANEEMKRRRPDGWTPF